MNDLPPLRKNACFFDYKPYPLVMHNVEEVTRIVEIGE
jgi:hypothetical protein